MHIDFFFELYNPVCQLSAEHTYIHFRCSARVFSATCLQQKQGSVVEGLSQRPLLAIHNGFLSKTLSCALS